MQVDKPAYRQAPLWTLIALPVGALLAISVAATVFVLSESIYREYSKVLSRNLFYRAQRDQDRLQVVLKEIQRDVEFLRNTPPIQGLIRSEKADRIDPLDGSSYDTWTQRLSVIFRAILIAKPEYLQVRFIGLADEGRELVRVERDLATGLIFSPTQLQQKLSRPYVREAFAGAPDDVYVSPIDLNREFGEIQEPLTPVFRASLPVYDSVTQEPFGVIVINLAAEVLFDALTRDSGSEVSRYVANASGELLVAPAGDETFAFEFGGRSNILDQLPELQPMFSGEQQTQSMEVADGRSVLGSTIDLGDHRHHARLHLILTREPTQAQALVSLIQKQTLSALVVVLLLSGAAGYGIAILVARPLQKLASHYTKDPKAPAYLVPNLTTYREAAELSVALGDAFTRQLQTNADLASSNRELDQFAYIASHDLQEPVRSIRTMAEMIASDEENTLSDQGRRALGYLEKSTTRMSELIHGLLEYSRLGSKRAPEPVDLSAVFAAIIADLKTRIDETHGRVEVPAQLPTLQLFGLEVRLLFQNLISNALKFCPSDRTPQVQIRASKKGLREWQFCVSDNGIGIPQKQQEKIFLIFQRATQNPQYEGTGIGLAHCRKIAEMHHGKIWVDSSDEQGTTICLTLCEITNDAIQGNTAR